MRSILSLACIGSVTTAFGHSASAGSSFQYLTYQRWVEATNGSTVDHKDATGLGGWTATAEIVKPFGMQSFTRAKAQQFSNLDPTQLGTGGTLDTSAIAIAPTLNAQVGFETTFTVSEDIDVRMTGGGWGFQVLELSGGSIYRDYTPFAHSQFDEILSLQAGVVYQMRLFAETTGPNDSSSFGFAMTMVPSPASSLALSSLLIGCRRRR